MSPPRPRLQANDQDAPSPPREVHPLAPQIPRALGQRCNALCTPSMKDQMNTLARRHRRAPALVATIPTKCHRQIPCRLEFLELKDAEKLVPTASIHSTLAVAPMAAHRCHQDFANTCASHFQFQIEPPRLFDRWQV